MTLTTSSTMLAGVTFCLVVFHAAYADFGMTCSRKSIFGIRETFRCPGLLDDEDEKYCCGPSDNQHCCDDEDFLVSIGTGAIVAIIISVLVVVGSLVLLCCCCCSCCILAKRRQRRGMVIATATPAQTTTYNNYPVNMPNQQQPMAPPQAYAPVPPQGYAPVPQNYPMQQQPAYPGGYPAAGTYPAQPMPSEYSKPPPYSAS